ncbi:MAG: AmmeMemoRadiSam system radical SAM enzyme [Deltaproteobacteria bacterium]|nr:AmmeMemoRadiSam system radical SAM enzyme [Deltaproteobacteria bacterium]
MSRSTLTRRGFLRSATRIGGSLIGGGVLLLQPSWLGHLFGDDGGRAKAGDQLSELIRNAPRARFWVSLKTPNISCQTCHNPNTLQEEASYQHDGVSIKCRLCSQGCVIKEGERGRCGARFNFKGELRSLVYGRPISIHVDPIEKKPFYHFLPGKNAFSFATSGCPLHCSFCQNWEISQARPEDYSTAFFSPSRMVEQAAHQKAPIIAFTYNEPTVFAEYLIDVARASRPKGLRNVLVSCGFMTPEPLAEMCRVLDAIKIDLKGFSPEFYRKVCRADLKPVLRSIKQIAKSRVHLEIVNLVVPTLNDSDAMLKALSKWIVNEIGVDVPVHFTRFHPDYQLRNLPPTPRSTLERARATAMDHGIRYAFVGNLPGHPGNHSYCPKCGKIVIERNGFFVEQMHLRQGRCEYCQEKIAGVWS